jgi:DNA repair exonuclease SbcCD ATPase subunit
MMQMETRFMTLDELERSLSSAERAVLSEKAVVESLAERGKKAAGFALDAKNRALACEEASKLLASFADARQEQIVKAIETITSAGLTQVFGEPIEIKIEQVTRARRIEMDVKVKTGSLETSIMDARGGGLAAVAGFLLRITVLLLTKNARRLLIADEPFAMLSEEYLNPMAEFLAELCSRTGLQLVLVTHQMEFADAADRVLKIEKTGQNTAKFVVEK